MIDEVARIISPVYMVGGSVRDELLGLTPKDYDFTTPMKPDEIEKAIKDNGRRAYIAGKRFGTVGFKLNDKLIEITTFRSEVYSPGSRKPRVEYVDNITHDLSRRDFTINAIAKRQDGRIVDPFGGRNDIRDRIIRTVGKPQERFREDPLRMLRAGRFAAQLNFTIDDETEARASKRAYHILEVSKERWVQELDKLLVSDCPAIGLGFLARTRLLHFMLPELGVQVDFDQDSPYHELNLWDHTLKTVQLMPRDVDLRWAALLHDVGKSFTHTKNKRGYSNFVHHEKVSAEMVVKIAKYLRWSNDRTEKVTDLVRYHLLPESPLGAADTAATKAD